MFPSSYLFYFEGNKTILNNCKLDMFKRGIYNVIENADFDTLRTFIKLRSLNNERYKQEKAINIIQNHPYLRGLNLNKANYKQLNSNIRKVH